MCFEMYDERDVVSRPPYTHGEYRSSNASGPASQREEFRVGFFACFNRLWDLVNLRNDIQHYQEGFFVFDIPTFNESVVREAIQMRSATETIKWSGVCLFVNIPTGLFCHFMRINRV